MKQKLRKLIAPILVWWVLRKIVQERTDDGIMISLWDSLPPEASATVQSMNSRSAGGFLVNLRKVVVAGYKYFMKKFYSGYGHKSIADCGSTSAALGGLSMLSAKAWQDWQLYNGQETSTRYIDVTGLGYVDPVQTDASGRIMRVWFDLYTRSLIPTINHLKKMNPLKEGQDAEKWATALEKRAYDILGSLLPAGTRTNASVHMTLRQWDDKLAYMIHHPLKEVRNSGRSVLRMLQKKYPGTFVKNKTYPKAEQYRATFMHEAYFAKEGSISSSDFLDGFLFTKNFQDDFLIDQRRKTAETRPEKTELPKIFNQAGNYRMEFLIDYRSFRDWQRQRSAVQDHPLLTMGYGFEEWYLDQMPMEVRQDVEETLASQKIAIMNLPCDELVRQYYIPMGYKVFTRFTLGLADMVYVIELRTPTTVHPTARIVAQKAYLVMEKILPKYFVIYADMKADELDIRRADHDIFFDGKRLSEK